MRKKFVRGCIVAIFALVLVAAAASAGMLGKLYVKRTDLVLTERSGPACRDAADTYCEHNYDCPPGLVAHGLVYNFKEDKSVKRLAGLALVCSDPNGFANPEIVGPGGENFVGAVMNDYCPMGYLLAGAEYSTSDRHDITGVRRICRRYRPYEERRGPNMYGEGLDTMLNVCGDHHWVTGLKVSFTRNPAAAGPVDDEIISTRFYCAEVRDYIVEPTKEELEKQFR
jgi:hypothetical protein